MENNATLAVVSTIDLERLVKTAVVEALSTYHLPTPPPAPASEALTFDQVRVRLKISAPTLRKMVRSGTLHAVRTGRRWLVPSVEVERFLQGQA
ncbi:MAG: DNA-binding protein [Chlorobi bacterium]|nr:DNA-binding protein [Chlorobiota bacterium]NOG67315.1 helix-turn-helix domain-containing protein [Chlorobiota bacterium]